MEKGSTWNKWDFHVHTPYSILNNEYGFDPFEESNGTDLFDNYVVKLFTKAIEIGIVAIGITDYFSIDGYKKIREEYLSKTDVMERLFPDKELREKIMSIFVFPNIELRLGVFVGADKNSINYHVIFSDDLRPIDIEEGFLHRLKIQQNTQQVLMLNKYGIETIGRDYKRFNSDGRPDYLVGLEKVTVDYQDVMDVLNESALLEGKYLISIPVDEDLSDVSWNGRDYQTRKILYQQSDLLMTSNPKTREWALAKGHEKEQISEFGSIKPCIWGSDAHDYERMFNPAKNRFCWIKAQPSFEGLKQVLYEPDDRVMICSDGPKIKDEHYLIDYIVFNDEKFTEEPVYFSDGLTAIIGGKSTGKSMLLRHVAKNADPDEYKRKEPLLEESKFVNAQLHWKDGVLGNRKIIYIPQSWLNRVVDVATGDNQLNEMIRDVLLQTDPVSEANKELTSKIDQLKMQIKNDLFEYRDALSSWNECEKTLNEKGRSTFFISAIQKLETQRAELSSEAGITEEMLKNYSDFERHRNEKSVLLNSLRNEETTLKNLGIPMAYIQGITKFDDFGAVKYDFSSVPNKAQQLSNTLLNINTQAQQLWMNEINKFCLEIKQEIDKTDNEIKLIEQSLAPLKKLIEKSDMLRIIDNQLQEEKKRLAEALETEAMRDQYCNIVLGKHQSIMTKRQAMEAAYKEFAEVVNGLQGYGSELKFAASVEYKKNDLYEAILGIYDYRNLKAFKENGYSFVDVDEFVADDRMFATLWKAMADRKLNFKGGNDMLSALEVLYSDWQYVHYIIQSGGDTINDMSPGKKALVLLQLIISLEKGNCPILIDQPEDDLDNRSIFNDLVRYLREKKKERQIIVVTHNANVVVGSDAEEVIIANQDGKETENYSRRFEYRCGAIEEITPVYDRDRVKKGVLYQKGIQEQICDILEGGKDAFDLRRNKYSLEMK